MMRPTRMALVGALASAVLFWAAPAFGQANPDAKACRLLSVPELEAHFGGKSISVKGSDTSTFSMCSVRINDMRHEASLNIRPPSPAGQAVTIQQRLDIVANSMKRDKPLETKVFGSVGCFKSDSELGDKPLPTTTCFLVNDGGYISLTIASDDPKQTTFDAVKALLEKAAARRK
jgi:hypothetical protein